MGSIRTFEYKPSLYCYISNAQLRTIYIWHELVSPTQLESSFCNLCALRWSAHVFQIAKAHRLTHSYRLKLQQLLQTLHFARYLSSLPLQEIALVASLLPLLLLLLDVGLETRVVALQRRAVALAMTHDVVHLADLKHCKRLVVCTWVYGKHGSTNTSIRKL